MNELISIIIPIYSEIDNSIASIESALNQTYPKFELIIVNDGSLESDERLLFWINERVLNGALINYIKLKDNLGPATARNIGIKESRGEYIAFLDSDDVWMPDKLEVQVAIMKKMGWFASHTSYKRIYSKSKKSKVIQSGRLNYSYFRVIFACRIAMPTVILRSEVLQEIRFRDGLRVGEDTMLWADLTQIGYNIYGLDDITTNVYVDEYTTAFNLKAQLDAIKVIRSGIKNKKILFLFEIFSIIRKIKLHVVKKIRS
ncbi:glycosyltransferase family 2 protein [Polynucleobacter sp. AP-Ainpum-60-G11]|uniref:glycosyltransferase family 2 protein n=1 Tax=Polynucleobacter sp. AP-Ainpum-60-G11 TaxID=2576926 RepID=UPI001BFCEE19|nr:glycosyltransferase family 2 protein [Polynucleobacter sp. AP-Ainpum-60-G11]QWE27023.1 glycosyltransferase family 2 protein [Polynucleobacter sp. AP-Ainpum-60-G11]